MRAVISANVEDLSCVCDEIARVIKSAESSKIAESSVIFLLNGDIGAGKTTLVKAFARYVGIKESVTSPTFSLLHIYGSLNSSLGMQFRTCEKFWESADSSPALSQNFSQIQKPHRKILEFEDSNTNNSSDSNNFCDSKNDKNKSREAQPLASSGVGEGVVREGEGSDFAIRKNPCIQAPSPSLKENARDKKGESKADLSAQRRGEKEFLCASAQNDNKVDCHADSANLLAMTKNTRITESMLTLYHYDLYQKGVDSAIDLGLLDLLSENGIHFVEWGDERLFNILKDAFENIFIIQIIKAKNDRIYEFKSEF